MLKDIFISQSCTWSGQTNYCAKKRVTCFGLKQAREERNTILEKKITHNLVGIWTRGLLISSQTLVPLSYRTQVTVNVAVHLGLDSYSYIPTDSLTSPSRASSSATLLSFSSTSLVNASSRPLNSATLTRCSSRLLIVFSHCFLCPVSSLSSDPTACSHWVSSRETVVGERGLSPGLRGWRADI